MKALLSKTYQFRKHSELPFYCKPVQLFAFIWLTMLVSFHLRFSYSSYPDASTAWFLFIASMGSFLLGYFIVRLFSLVRRPHETIPNYQVNLTRLRKVYHALFVICGFIIIVNLVFSGLPPLFGIFGSSTLNYLEYGKLKQPLDAATMCIFLMAPLESSKPRRLLMYWFPILSMIVYVTRGFLLITLFQGLLVFSLRTKMKKRNLYFLALVCLVVAVLIADVLGNSRSATQTAALFVAFFNIKSAYANWPMMFLWIISYIGIPFSNLCWIVHAYPYRGPTPDFLSSLLPAFLAPPGLGVEAGDLGSIDIIDGVHTYLAKYYISLWFVGIFLVNFLWGLISGYLSLGNRIARKYLTSSVFLAAIAFMFFVDYITMLSIVMELFTLAFVQQYAMKSPSTPVNPQSI